VNHLNITSVLHLVVTGLLFISTAGCETAQDRWIKSANAQIEAEADAAIKAHLEGPWPPVLDAKTHRELDDEFGALYLKLDQGELTQGQLDLGIRLAIKKAFRRNELRHGRKLLTLTRQAANPSTSL
jgi:hypothetical protein